MTPGVSWFCGFPNTSVHFWCDVAARTVFPAWGVGEDAGTMTLFPAWGVGEDAGTMTLFPAWGVGEDAGTMTLFPAWGVGEDAGKGCNVQVFAEQMEVKWFST